jgi:hypothetical protein
MIPNLFAQAPSDSIGLTIAAFLIVAVLGALVVMFGIALKLFERYVVLLEKQQQSDNQAAADYAEREAHHPTAMLAFPVSPAAQPVAARASGSAAMQVTANSSSGQPGETISAEIAATIAAAVAMTLDKPHRILDVSPVMQPMMQPQWVPGFVVSPWAVEGRAQIFSGRRVR